MYMYEYKVNLGIGDEVHYSYANSTSKKLYDCEFMGSFPEYYATKFPVVL